MIRPFKLKDGIEYPDGLNFLSVEITSNTVRMQIINAFSDKRIPNRLSKLACCLVTVMFEDNVATFGHRMQALQRLISYPGDDNVFATTFKLFDSWMRTAVGARWIEKTQYHMPAEREHHTFYDKYITNTPAAAAALAAELPSVPKTKQVSPALSNGSSRSSNAGGGGGKRKSRPQLVSDSDEEGEMDSGHKQPRSSGDGGAGGSKAVDGGKAGEGSSKAGNAGAGGSSFKAGNGDAAGSSKGGGSGAGAEVGKVLSALDESRCHVKYVLWAAFTGIVCNLYDIDNCAAIRQRYSRLFLEGMKNAVDSVDLSTAGLPEWVVGELGRCVNAVDFHIDATVNTEDDILACVPEGFRVYVAGTAAALRACNSFNMAVYLQNGVPTLLWPDVSERMLFVVNPLEPGLTWRLRNHLYAAQHDTACLCGVDDMSPEAIKGRLERVSMLFVHLSDAVVEVATVVDKVGPGLSAVLAPDLLRIADDLKGCAGQHEMKLGLASAHLFGLLFMLSIVWLCAFYGSLWFDHGLALT